MAEIGNRVRDWVAVDMTQPVSGNVQELGPAWPDFADLPGPVEIYTPHNLPIWVRLRRPDDLLVLDCALFNFRRRGQEWRRREAAKPAFLVVTHQAQALGEAAYLLVNNEDQEKLHADEDLIQPPPKPKDENPDDPENPSPPAEPLEPRPLDEPIPHRVPASLAGPSRLVYRMPKDAPPLAHSMAAFLEAMRTWPLALAPGARADVDGPDLGRWRDLGRRLNLTIEQLRAGLQGHVSQAAVTRLVRLARQEARGLVTELEAGRSPAPDGFTQVLDRALDAEFPARSRTRNLPRRTVSLAGRPDIVIDEQALSREIGHRLQLAESAKTIADQLALGRPIEIAKIRPDILAYLAPPPTAPGPQHTALELPYRLISSPLPGAGFTHALDPVNHGGRTELWHTRLGSRTESDDGLRVDVDDQRGRMIRMHWRGEKLRFVWSPDYNHPDKPANGVHLSLDALDRDLLVRATAGFDQVRPPFTPRAVHVERLMLSALGGDLEAGRSWKKHELPSDVDIKAWTHRAFLGREAFVRVEYSGFLYPFGHPASLIKVTWRNFQWRNENEKDRRLAVLRQRFYIVVRNQVMPYPAKSPVPSLGRQLPFHEIHCLVNKTPDLERPGVVSPTNLGDSSYRVSTKDFYRDIGGENGWRRAFWPKRGSDFLFPFVGVDSAGSRIRFNLPAMFISDVVNTEKYLGPLQAYYNGNGRLQRRTAGLQGQVVRLAPAATGAADVDYPMDDLVIEGANPSNGVRKAQSEALQQFPVMASGHVHLTALEQVTGQARVEDIKYEKHYLDHGLDKDRGHLFAEIQMPTALNFGGNGVRSDTTGGVATPSLIPSGLSARHGVASGNLDSFSQNRFEPADFFPDARLLGIFKFSDVLKPAALGQADAPIITNIDGADGMTTRFQIRQRVTSSSEPELIPASGGSPLVLNTTIFTPRDGSAPRREVEGSLSDFKLNLAGCLILKFDRLRFYQVDGRKPDIEVDLDKDHGVTFGGPLRFVNRLRDFIPANGFSDPPALDVTPSGLTVSYGLGLPDIQVGILALSNVSLGAAFTLPFTGEAPSARFNFAERHDPFNLTVSMFGGGGFLALKLDSSGVQQIEAALEFGARISIDLGVASGSVSVKGGFYFSYGQEQVVFEGYVELGGRLKVIGLITASLTFHLSLSYEVQGSKNNGGRITNRLFGQAILIVEVSVLCFSASVSVRCSRTFKGSESDPTFEDFLPQPELWADYCNAFA